MQCIPFQSHTCPESFPLQVHPAATFAAKVKERGGKVAIFNIENGKRDSVADFVFLGPCEEILPKVLAVDADADA